MSTATEPNTSAPQYIQIARITNGWLVGVQHVRGFDCNQDVQYCFTTAESLAFGIANLVTYGTINCPVGETTHKVTS